MYITDVSLAVMGIGYVSLLGMNLWQAATASSEWPGVAQTISLALIAALVPVLALWINAKLKRIEGQANETKAIANETKVMVNSGSQIQMELRLTDLEELLLAKPGDVSVLARLEAIKKLLADHKIKAGVAAAMPKPAPTTGMVQ